MPPSTVSNAYRLTHFLKKSRMAFAYSFGFSFVINILMLGMSMYSLQVLDRVLSSGSLETLGMLSLIMLVIFIVLGALQIIRSFIFLDISHWIDSKLSSILLGLSISFKQKALGAQYLRDLSTIKSFVTGQAITQLFDAPWAVIFLLVIFLIHPINGWITVMGAVILTGLAWCNERMTSPHLKNANESHTVVMQEVSALTRNAEVIDAMGMKDHIIKNWQVLNKGLLGYSRLASTRSAVISAITKGFRMTVQMVTMGVGAVLVIKNDMSAGGIIATSILAGKALAPFDAMVMIWKSWVSSRASYDRLNRVMMAWDGDDALMSLPAPHGTLDIQRCVYGLPGTDRMIIKGVNISVTAGQCVGVVGPSGSGKTTLARLITGVLVPGRGMIRLDGANLSSWNTTELGRYIGYLPQDIELFSGTIQDNIARMNRDADPDKVIEAAKRTQTHDFILNFPYGYNTTVGSRGHYLSGGQRQRIAMVRAFYGDPKLVVLDEPNAHLDTEGETALHDSIKWAKGESVTTIIISHKPAVLNMVDVILVMRDGEAVMFDKRDRVLSHLSGEVAHGGGGAS